MTQIVIQEEEGLLDEALSTLPGILSQANQLVNSNKQVELAKAAQANADKRLDMQVAEYEYNTKIRKEQEDMKDLLFNSTSITHPSNSMVQSGKGAEYDWNAQFGADLPDYYDARMKYTEGAKARGITPDYTEFDSQWQNNQRAYFNKELKSFNALYDHYKDTKGWSDEQIYKELKQNHNADKMYQKWVSLYPSLELQQMHPLKYTRVSGKGRTEQITESATNLVYDSQAGEMTWTGRGLAGTALLGLGYFLNKKLGGIPKHLVKFFKFDKSGKATSLSKAGLKETAKNLDEAVKTKGQLPKTGMQGTSPNQPPAVKTKLPQSKGKVNQFDFDKFWEKPPITRKTKKATDKISDLLKQYEKTGVMPKTATKRQKERILQRAMKWGRTAVPSLLGYEGGQKFGELLGLGETGQALTGVGTGIGVHQLMKNMRTPAVKRAVLKVGGRSMYKKMLAAATATMAPEAASTVLGLVGWGLMANDIRRIMKDPEVIEAVKAAK